MPRLRWGPASSAGLALSAAVSAVVSIVVLIERGVVGLVFLAFAAVQAAMSYFRARGGH